MTIFVGNLGVLGSGLGTFVLGGAPAVSIPTPADGEIRHHPRFVPPNRDDYLGRTIRTGRRQASEGGNPR